MKTLKSMSILFVIGMASGCYPVPVTNTMAYSDSDYYYYPDQEVYYYPTSSQYIYYDGGAWTYAAALPPRYSVNLYTTNRVVLNYSGKDPYRNHDQYRQEYPRGYQGQRLTAPARQSTYRQANQRGNNVQKQTPPSRQPRVRRSPVDNPGKVKPTRKVRSEK